MINKDLVKKLVQEFIEDKEIFLVDIKVSTSNRISILVNKPGDISVDDCVQISRHIEANIDREIEDYELNVSSPGINIPFKVREQYEISIGRMVEVVDNEGNKLKGTLTGVEGEGFEIKYEKKHKGKKSELLMASFNFEDVKSVKEVISFK